MSMNSSKAVTKKNGRKRSPNYLTKECSDFIVGQLQYAFDNCHASTDFGSIRLQYLKDSVWSKYADALPGTVHSDQEARDAAAIAKWLHAEARNRSTNLRLKQPGVDFGYFTSDRLLAKAREFVLQVLGSKPPRLIVGEFTNGASTRVKRSEVSIAQKFEGRPHVTPSAAMYWTGLALEFPLWQLYNPQVWDVELQESSVMFTVPKNAHFSRVACKEPEANMFLQRGLGLFIRKRLKKVGIDLTDQSRNQDLARDGRKAGLATIDLSSASDTISMQVVSCLLPPDWVEALSALRAESTILPDGQVHTLEMFSSMGNGFTFELESLVFWALTRACAYLLGVRGAISVYGDDIICPIPCARLLHRVFAYLGFTVNLKKSCISGNYRESCGAHFYGVQSITPFYIRKRPTEVRHLIQIGNQLLAWMLGEEYIPDIPKSLVTLWLTIAEAVNPKLYGGLSLERTDALVTGHQPRKRLHQVVEEGRPPEQGAYLQWHFDKTVRFHEEPESPSEVARKGRWVLRPNRTWHDEELRWLVNNHFSLILEKYSQV